MTCPDAAQHPGSNYYVNLATGTIQRQSGLLGNVLGLAGYYGPMDWCQATAFAANYTTSGALHGSAEAHAAGAAAATVTQGVPDFLGKLGSRNLWLRVLKVLGGLVLIITGVAQLTHAQNIAASAAKGAVLA